MSVRTSRSELGPPGCDSGWQRGSERSETRRRTAGEAGPEGNMTKVWSDEGEEEEETPPRSEELRVERLAHLQGEKKS